MSHVPQSVSVIRTPIVLTLTMSRVSRSIPVLNTGTADQQKACVRWPTAHKTGNEVAMRLRNTVLATVLSLSSVTAVAALDLTPPAVPNPYGSAASFRR